MSIRIVGKANFVAGLSLWRILTGRARRPAIEVLAAWQRSTLQ